jgi:hypothetical protein
MSAECEDCKNPIPIDLIGPCPKCGSYRRLIKPPLDSGHGEDRLAELTKENSLTRKNLLDVVLFALTITGPLACYYFFTPLAGTIVGVFFGLVNYVLAPYSKWRELRIDRTKYVYDKQI